MRAPGGTTEPTGSPPQIFPQVGAELFASKSGSGGSLEGAWFAL